MVKSLQLFAILLISCIKIQSIYSIDNLYTSKLNNVYYMDNEQKYTWFDALSKCARMNMSLATIDTKEKSDDITDLMKATFSNPNPLWIGGAATGSDHHYVWISNGEKFDFTNWNPGEPSYYSESELCLLTGWNAELRWNDHQCHKTFGMLCELSQYYYWEEEIQEELQREVADKQQLQNNLDKSQLLLQLLLDYRKSHISDGKGYNTIRDIFLNL
ncbi:lactose-binding lectin l-2-like [Lucilia sericata]|uniref:lactose-binding lectin l-2-like n=1 Tax=Lucilia sericata TaxID=13632 RepID=UPI0018A872CE|nr:lactose-binding lectin l-2-like [Lucilia sericata]